MGVRNGVEVAGQHLARDKPGEVRHVHQQRGPDLVSDLAHRGEVDPARVRGVPGHQHERLEVLGDLAHG